MSSQKTVFLLVELSFAQNIREKHHTVVVMMHLASCVVKGYISLVPDHQKHLDVFATPLGLFFLAFDLISSYTSLENILTCFLILHTNCYSFSR